VSPTLILTAILVFITIGGVGFVFAGDGSRGRTMKRAATITGAGRAAERVRAKAAAADPTARRKQILKSLKEQDRQNRKASLSLGARLVQAGLPNNVPGFWIASGVTGAVVLGLTYLLTQKGIVAFGVGFAAAFGLPQWVVSALGQRRIKKFSESFSDAIDVIVRGIKSGLPVHDALKIIGKESAEPLAGEFVRLVENIGMGMTIDQALEKMYERMPTPELRFFTIVLTIQAKTGGNLSEALGNLSHVLRARKLMREKIKALSSEAIASAVIIGALPPGVMMLIMVTTPAYMAKMFSDPRGNVMLIGGGFWMLLGIWVMRKMINFKF
jgi:tight adherence protein B